ncbi:3'(2'),5'-bisphosphate nucleotidase CysQ [Vibrio fluvialis]|jgi:3'(2'), 5'-bisphosphate nucleotidase|uniref:3'(2'),5'-bisphosphate nucleotidase CysQ n=1 Tax=Vibrio fluvialis TaxID=676 RepID=A0AAX2LMG7_VIBFL|nr:MULTISPECIES: 3'(2'),5'-bisphosphate nucleotidase CysQ [Vibrio]TNF20002.1 MAG: 3'(2'),5'-bisphosphate nucleotidase [Vibrionaceae bacterium]HDM8035999.1 3'(2'),5'-bisphosphate nucleotidase CysQ [Vibrio fluvialis clinical-1]AMF95876.1 3'(2'),5'-bisphosphate nucleotidase [Vibrio fluvialis]EKO3374044.1 3'(2'),5'-bisphosphate nucleotidase CysQ [Vibrio fluvialis]EKO3377360.1 3'(2'),5'-bisphosphate nucleotidase CysQ [Vibrio fluvialis]
MPTAKDLSHLLPDVISIARSAGQLILDIYENKSYESYTKSDETPVTSADLAAHKLVVERLSELTPDIPVLSEEAANISLTTRETWQRYWLVDPLDGTQEFIARSGDFATIIALVENNRPVMGVVYGPVSGVTYYAYSGKGAWKIPDMSESLRIETHKHELPGQSIAIAISRRQDINRITNRLSSQWNYELVPLGSAALKACLVAEGAVDCYLRLGPTGEWDTAATQCIVEEAGGRILSTQLEPLSYNERDTLENPNFIVLGDADLPWDKILKVKD